MLYCSYVKIIRSFVMKIHFLLIGTSLSLIPQTINAQCVATQDCETLGYTETSCSGGKGIKCPFGNKWACCKSEAEICNKLGFTLSCTGANQTGGSGKSCNGKYAECNCADGYQWKDGTCKASPSGAQGNLYYCNGTIVGVKTSDMDFYVAMNDLNSMGWSSANDACNNYSFCGTLKGILPSKNQLTTMYNNKSELEKLLTSNGGSKFATDDYYWSSTAEGYNLGFICYGIVNMSNGNMTNYCGSPNYHVRPILTSY